jgi:hypothetical protein
MSFARFGLLLAILILNMPIGAQQTQTATTPPPAPKDSQAVSVVNQALGAAGGVPAITAITDYTGSGNITYHWGVDHDVQGGVTVRAKGLNQFRLDASLPSGVRSEATDGSTTIKFEDGSIKALRTQAPLYPARIALPYLQLNAASTSPSFSLSYKGSVNIDGRPAQDIEVQRILPGGPEQNARLSDYLTVDYFIDSSTLQVVMMQDVDRQHLVRQIRYADFRPVNGVLAPFSIAETVRDQKTWQIQLNQISFNSALQDSDFQL